jgi:hypothetical protein
MSPLGPLRHLMRRSDMSGVGGRADIVQNQECVEADIWLVFDRA